jgi:poly(3-hydroxybutyrate) depolymerase
MRITVVSEAGNPRTGSDLQLSVLPIRRPSMNSRDSQISCVLSTNRGAIDLCGTTPRASAWLLIGATGYLLLACSAGNSGIATNPTTGASGARSNVGAIAGNTASGIAGVTSVSAGVSGSLGSAAGSAATSVTPTSGGIGGVLASGGRGGVVATAGSGPLAGSSGNDSDDAGVEEPRGGAGALATAGAGGASGVGGMGGAGAPPTCDKIPPASTDCMQPLSPGDARKCAMTVALNQRSYYLYAPKTYNPCKPTALIIDCHGAMETAEAQAGIDTLHVANTTNGPLQYPGIGSGWRLEADTPDGGFIVVTPQGINNVWSSANNDPQFFLDIVTAVKKIANVAVDKVYMTGISNGSLISYETACAHTDVFSGIAAFSAGQNCPSIGKPIPVISFDASPDFAYQTTVAASDTMVRLDQCKGAVNPKWLTIDTSTTDTVCRNDPFDTHPTLVPCNTITKTSITPSGIEPTVCKRWDMCSGGVAVAFCDVAPSTLHGAANAAVDAHILYGNATSLNMPSVAWRFFKSFWK